MAHYYPILDITLASGSNDTTVRLWNVPLRRLRTTLKGHKGIVFAGAFSPDGQTLASGGQDYTVRLWDVNTGQLRHILPGHTGKIYSLAFSPNAPILTTASGDLTVRLWNVSTILTPGILTGNASKMAADHFDDDEKKNARQSYHILRGHTAPVTTVAFSPNGQTLASGSNDTTVRLWDVLALLNADGDATWPKNGEATEAEPTHQLLQGHTGWVWSVAFSPDGILLASASDDRTVRLWDLATRQVRQILQGHTLWVYCVAFSPDGEIVASCSGDKTIRLWDVQTGDCLKVLRIPGPYQGMNISGVTGITVAQKIALKALGAVE